jgi:hypothetical protein
MDMETSDLEWRVLAHEQILQVLLAHMCEAKPKFLERLQQIFIESQYLGWSDLDCTDTLACAHQFIDQIVRLKDSEREGTAVPV